MDSSKEPKAEEPQTTNCEHHWCHNKPAYCKIWIPICSMCGLINGKDINDQLTTLLSQATREARIDEWNLISETVHSGGIVGELYINDYRKDRIAELKGKDK